MAGGGVCVRVSNTLLNLVTYWDMSKFELRLEQMREMYQTRGSGSSLEEGTVSPVLNEDPFNAPSDSWEPSPFRYDHTHFLTPLVQSACHRSLQRSHSLQSTPSVATPTRPLPFDLRRTLHSKSSAYGSPVTPLREDRPHPSTSTTVSAVLLQLSRLLDWKEGLVCGRGEGLT